MIQVSIFFSGEDLAYSINLPALPRKGDILRLEYDLIVNGRELQETTDYKVRKVVFVVDKGEEVAVFVYVKERRPKRW